MTEEEWLACADPRPMLTFVQRRITNRRARLFAVLACRVAPTIGAYETLEDALSVAERLVDGGVSIDDLCSATRSVTWGRYEPCESLNRLSLAIGIPLMPVQLSPSHAWEVVDHLAAIHPLSTPNGREEDGYPQQSDFVRELFPFRRVKVDRRWLTSTVVQLAQGIYDDRAFDRMPILADALQDAGCENADVLNHCRDPKATHVRGCWVVDLLLGKV